MSDHLVAKKASAEFVSALDKYERAIIRLVNTNIPGSKIRLDLGGNPNIC